MDKTGSRRGAGGDYLQLMPRGQEFSIMAGMAVEEVSVRANGKRGGARHTIWFATKTDRA